MKNIRVVLDDLARLIDRKTVAEKSVKRLDDAVKEQAIKLQKQEQTIKVMAADIERLTSKKEDDPHPGEEVVYDNHVWKVHGINEDCMHDEVVKRRFVLRQLESTISPKYPEMMADRSEIRRFMR